MIFPVVSLSKDFFGAFTTDRFPRPRENALTRALKDRVIVLGKVHPDNPIRVQPGYIRSLDAWLGPVSELSDCDSWEDSILGESFPAVVATQGEAIRELLKPAFYANDHLRIIDPYLQPWSKFKRQIRSVLELAGGVCKMECFSGIPSLKPDNKKMLKHERYSLSAHFTPLSQWLAEYLGNNAPTRLDGVNWYLYDYRDGDKIHDRYVGLSRLVRSAKPSWHAASIGYGVQALSDGNCKSCCVARISQNHFIQSWEQAENRARWRLRFTRAAPPQKLTGYSCLDDGVSGDWHYRVEERLFRG